MSLTFEQWLEVVKINGLLIKNIPNEFKTIEMYKEASHQNGLAIQYFFIPSEQNINVLDDTLDVISMDVVNNMKVYFNAVENTYKSFDFVPVGYRIEDLCDIAFRQNINSIKYIPKQITTKEMWIKAINENATLFDYLPDEYQNDEVYQKLIENHIELIMKLPDEYKTVDKYLQFVRINPENYNLIPDDIKIEEFNVQLLDIMPELINSINNPSEEMYITIIKNNDTYLRLIPKGRRTYNIYLELVKRNFKKINEVPEKMLCDEIILESLIRNYKYYDVPEKYKTINICKYLISRDKQMINKCPVTTELIEYAINLYGIDIVKLIE